MRGLCVLALLAAMCGIIGADSSIFSGFLGCRFSESVCRHYEECVDDRLFGTCQKLSEPRDNYQYILSATELRALEYEIAGLIQSGKTWDNLYTQCVLTNILIAYRSRQTYDPDFCDNGGISEGALSNRLTDATVDLLKSYLEDYYLSLTKQQNNANNYPIDEYDMPLEEKDEVIKIHKYLKSHKRNPLPYSDDEFNQPMGQVYEASEGDGKDYDVTGILQNLSPEKLKLLEEYLGPLPTEGLEVQEPVEPFVPAEKLGDELPLSDNIADDYGFVAPVEVKDAKILDQLLQGKASVSDLSDEDITNLSKYVDGILKPLRKYGATEEISSADESVSPGMSLISDDDIESVPDDIMQNVPDDIKPVKPPMLKEKLNNDVLKSASVDSLSSGHVLAQKRVHPNDPHASSTTPKPKLSIVDMDQVYLKVRPSLNKNEKDGDEILLALKEHLGFENDEVVFTRKFVGDDNITFHVETNSRGLNGSQVAALASGLYRDDIKNETSFDIYEVGSGNGMPVDLTPPYFVVTFVLCGLILGIVLAVIAIYVVKRHLQSKEKLAQLAGGADSIEASNDYQDLCRQRMQSKSSEKPEPLHISSRVGSVSASESAVRSPSSRSSTSSRSEEPVVSNMDISTGHIILSYMQDHMKNKDRLDQEWDGLCVYEAEPNNTSIAADPSNVRKNKYSDVLPYDHSRVILSSSTNVSGSDYINASTITDHDPRSPAYICTQGPLPHTVADFWQMVWEQGSVVIVNLTKLMENGQSLCHRYWPEEGSDLYHIYEVHLVSEHIWCDEYLVRCFYLKNLQTNETRTVSQFHFLSWPDLGIPASNKALLDFRRKVNKSYRGQNCPIVVQCSDGSGRSGCYSLLDMVLNRMSKGAKEIDIAATLEHIRDQRMFTVKTKEQFEFVLSSVAEEVNAILKALPQ